MDPFATSPNLLPLLLAPFWRLEDKDVCIHTVKNPLNTENFQSKWDVVILKREKEDLKGEY